jgi:hypothetical protein
LGQTIHITHKKEGVKIAPKELSAWACLLNKNGAILKTLGKHFLATTQVSGALQYAPQGCPDEYFDLKCWEWAVVGSDS